MLFTTHTERQWKQKLQDDPCSNQTEQLTSKPDFTLACLLSSVHFRCWDLWQVLVPGLTPDPYSREDKTPLPRTSSNCCSLLCVSNPITELHILRCLQRFCAWPCVLVRMHSLLRCSGFSPSPRLGGITLCRKVLQFLLMSSHDSKKSRQKCNRTNARSPITQANPTLQGEEALFFLCGQY